MHGDTNSQFPATVLWQSLSNSDSSKLAIPEVTPADVSLEQEAFKAGEGVSQHKHRLYHT